MENAAGGGGISKESISGTGSIDDVELFRVQYGNQHPTAIDRMTNANQNEDLDIFANLPMSNTPQPSFDTTGKPLKSSLVVSGNSDNGKRQVRSSRWLSASGKSESEHVIESIRESEDIVAALMGTAKRRNTTSGSLIASKRGSASFTTHTKSGSFNALKEAGGVINTSGKFGNSSKIAVSNDLTGLLQASEDTPQPQPKEEEDEGGTTRKELIKDQGKLPCNSFHVVHSNIFQIFHSKLTIIVLLSFLRLHHMVVTTFT